MMINNLARCKDVEWEVFSWKGKEPTIDMYVSNGDDISITKQDLLDMLKAIEQYKFIKHIEKGASEEAP